MQDKYGEIFAKNGKKLEINFYVNSEVSQDDPNGKNKMNSAGFVAEDGSIWLNADNISSISNFNLNSVFGHELTHNVTGKDTELLANFGEARASGFIEKAIDKGYLAKTGGGLNWNSETLTKEQKDRLASYRDIEEKLKVGNYVDNNVKNKLNNEINKKYRLKNFYISNGIQSLDNNGKFELAKEIVNEFVSIFGDEIFNYSQAQGQNKKKIGDEILKKYGISEEKLKSLENSDSYKWNGEGEKIVRNVILKNINIENNLNSILNNKNLSESQKVSEINKKYRINITIDDLRKPSELAKNIKENSSIQNIVEQDNIKLANSARWESKFFKDFYANTQKLTNRPLVIDEDDFVWYVGNEGYLSQNEASGNVSFISEKYMNSNENENAKIFDGYEKDGFFTKRTDEKITDDTIVWGNDKDKYKTGNALITEIINSKKTVIVEPSEKKNSPITKPENKINAFNGNGTDATIKMDFELQKEYLISGGIDEKKGLEKVIGKGNYLNYTAYGHELSHGLRAQKGNAIEGTSYYTYLDMNGKQQITGVVYDEEFNIDENITGEKIYQEIINNTNYTSELPNSLFLEFSNKNSTIYKDYISSLDEQIKEAKTKNIPKIKVYVPFPWKTEEFRTVGNPLKNVPSDKTIPTENDIRKEHGLPLRGPYTGPSGGLE